MAICRGCGKDIRDDIWVCGHCGELVGRNNAAASNGTDPGPSTGPGYLSGGAAGSSAGSGYLSAGVSGDAPPTYSPPQPVDGYSATNGYGASDGYCAPPTQPLPAPPPASSGGSSGKGLGSRTVMLIGVVGVIAVVAIVGVWFFLLRGGGGDFSAYVGQWELTVPGSTTALALTIQDNDGEPQLLMGSTSTATSQTAVQTAGPYKMQTDGATLVTTLEAADNASEEQKVAADAARAALGAVVDDFEMVFAPGSTADTLSLTVEGDIQGSSVFTGDVSSQALTLTRVGASASQAL